MFWKNWHVSWVYRRSKFFSGARGNGFSISENSIVPKACGLKVQVEIQQKDRGCGWSIYPTGQQGGDKSVEVDLTALADQDLELGFCPGITGSHWKGLIKDMAQSNWLHKDSHHAEIKFGGREPLGQELEK